MVQEYWKIVTCLTNYYREMQKYENTTSPRRKRQQSYKFRHVGSRTLARATSSAKRKQCFFASCQVLFVVERELIEAAQDASFRPTRCCLREPLAL
jgi:hypothetical protein